MFDVTGRRRRDAKPGPVKMYSVPSARVWRPAVGAPVQQPVRPHQRMPFLNARSRIASTGIAATEKTRKGTLYGDSIENHCSDV